MSKMAKIVQITISNAYSWTAFWQFWLNFRGLVDHMRASVSHDDVIKWKHFPRNWLFVRGIHRSPVNSQHTGQWHAALMFSLICVWINGWVNSREAGDMRRHRGHYDVIVMGIGLTPNRWQVTIWTNVHQTPWLRAASLGHNDTNESVTSKLRSDMLITLILRFLSDSPLLAIGICWPSDTCRYTYHPYCMNERLLLPKYWDSVI